MFTEALFIIAPKCKELKSSSVGTVVKQMVHPLDGILNKKKERTI